MTTIFGLPAHALLVHAIVVLAPLSRCARDSLRVLASRQTRLVWLVLAFAAATDGADLVDGIRAESGCMTKRPQHSADPARRMPSAGIG